MNRGFTVLFELAFVKFDSRFVISGRTNKLMMIEELPFNQDLKNLANVKE